MFSPPPLFLAYQDLTATLVGVSLTLALTAFVIVVALFNIAAKVADFIEYRIQRRRRERAFRRSVGL